MPVSTDSPPIVRAADWFAALRQDLVFVSRQLCAFQAAVHAGKADFGVVHKADGTPTTKADLMAQAHLLRVLQALTPNVPVISEEQSTFPSSGLPSRCWLVDPLDGTRSYLTFSREFSVNLAYLEQGRPVFGLIAIPAQDRVCWGSCGEASSQVWYGQLSGDAGLHSLLQCQRAPLAHIILSRSRRNLSDLSQLSTYVAQLPNGREPEPDQVILRQNAALKFVTLARRLALVQPRVSPTMEWDIAAGDAILQALGGAIVTPPGLQPMTYGKPRFANGAFIAYRP